VRPAAPQWTGWALAIAAAFCFSVATPAGRVAILGGMNPTALLVMRLLIATLLLFVTIAWQDPKLLFDGRRPFGIAFSAGLINSVGMSCYFWALKRIDASIASMLFALTPLFVLGMMSLRGETMRPLAWFRIALALGGVYFLVGPSGKVDPVGVALVLVSCLAFALQLVILHWYLRGYDSRTVTLHVLFGITTGLLAIWVWQGRPWSEPGPQGWVAVVVLSVVATFLARLALYASVRRLGSGETSLLTPLEIFMSVLWSVLILGERLTTIQWLGGVLIMASAFLAITSWKAPSQPAHLPAGEQLSGEIGG
jgi:drug/metabolite transporter (DMT)-like permease